ncbi:MAG TPA: T9SS type A sorting domain-containing protein, partial [Bacteroidales bacterium]|nr:T9SS type A sorting domain-containing protein [Bacteroidales bacterium]
APAGADATLLGYNVYRDNTLLDMVTGNEYFDFDLPAGTYSYKVTAVYDQGESMPAGPVTVSILVPPTLLVAEQQGSKVFLQWQSNFVVESDGSNKAKTFFDSYFKLYRNDVVIGEIYDLYHFDDAIAPGNEYCYSVSEVVSEEGLETAKSNEICVNIPVYGALAVTPGSLYETHSSPPQITTKILTVSNNGNGPIEFDAVVDFLGKDNRASLARPVIEIDPEWVAEQYAQRAALEGDPFSERNISPSRGGFMDNILEEFDLQFEYPVGVGGGEAGIEADANYIYTSKWNGSDFYRYDHDGTYVGSFAIPGAGQIRDLAYDGTYFYGGQGSSTVYIMDFVGQTLIGQFSAPTAVRAIAWDDGEEGLWANNWSTTITLFDLQGAVLGTIPTAGDESFYGFAYDHQGPYLWGYGQSGPNNNQLYKYALPGGSLELTHDVFPMLSLVASGDIAGGLAFQPDIVTGFNTLLGLVQNVCLWGIEMGNTTLFDIDVGVSSIVSPNSGVNLGSSEPVVIKIKNHGTNSVSNIPWSVNMTGQGSASFNGTYSGSLAPGADVEISVGTVNLSAYGIYNFEACTSLSGDQNPNNDCKTKPVTNNEPSLCIDNLYSTGCYSYGDGLLSWQLANINMDIPCLNANDWYHDYRDMVHEVEAGQTYVLTVTAGYTDTYFDVWIDFNNDLVLNNSDELILNDAVCATANTPYTFNITIPMDAPRGTHVMRFRTNWSSPVTDPCATYNYGNAADFVATLGTPWISIEPSAGSLNVGESTDVIVTFNSSELDYGVYNADILFASNNPFITQPEVTVPAQLTVGGVPSQNILMPLGWSGWSSYINTMGASFENVVAPVVNDMVITQHFTEMFWPQCGINTMGNFTNDHGYVSKMSAFATLSLEGMMATPTVALNAGWNLFPILVDCNLSAAEVFGGITGFIIGYEVAGNGIYYPAGSIATLTTLVPGKAYWVKVSGAATYTFPECVKGAKASYIAPLRHANTTPWNEPTYTGSSHIVVFNADASVSFAKGDMIGAFTNDGACAGLTLCDGKAVSLALFADDITTSVKDGFVQGESLTFKLYRQSNDTEYNLIVSYSSQAPNYDGLFEANGLSVINNVTMYATGIGSQDLTSLTVYPNPSQGLFNVSVDNHSQDVNWVVTDAKGRYVMEGRLADSHQIDLRTQPKGVYFIKFTGDNVLHIEKLVVR